METQANATLNKSIILKERVENFLKKYEEFVQHNIFISDEGSIDYNCKIIDGVKRCLVEYSIPKEVNIKSISSMLLSFKVLPKVSEDFRLFLSTLEEVTQEKYLEFINHFIIYKQSLLESGKVQDISLEIPNEPPYDNVISEIAKYVNKLKQIDTEDYSDSPYSKILSSIINYNDGFTNVSSFKERAESLKDKLELTDQILELNKEFIEFLKNTLNTKLQEALNLSNNSELASQVEALKSRIEKHLTGGTKIKVHSGGSDQVINFLKQDISDVNNILGQIRKVEQDPQKLEEIKNKLTGIVKTSDVEGSDQGLQTLLARVKEKINYYGGYLDIDPMINEILSKESSVINTLEAISQHKSVFDNLESTLQDLNQQILKKIQNIRTQSNFKSLPKFEK